MKKFFGAIAALAIILPSPVKAEEKFVGTYNQCYELAEKIKNSLESPIASENRTIVLKKQGLVLQIPLNYRAMAGKGNSVDVVDNSTFEQLQFYAHCNQTLHGVYGGGYGSLSIVPYKGYLLDGVVKQGGDIYIVQQYNEVQETWETYLRVKTSKGVFDIRWGSEGGIEVEEMRKVLRGIEIH